MAETTASATAKSFTKNIDDSIKKYEVLGDKLYVQAKQAASQQVGTVVEVIDNVLDAQTDLAKSSSLPWAETVADANASVVRSLTKSASDVAQTLLK
ncbi:MAG: hypothetical protein L0H59_12210 [Tomitella sp.]|nr:hypothetical protein [Tomitella sp.]